MIKWKKKIAVCLILVLGIFSLSACGNENDATAVVDNGEDGMRVAVVFSSSGLGDKSFNDSLYQGMEEAVEEFGITFDYSEPKDDAEYEPLLRGYADTGAYGLIVCLGYSQGTSLENVAPNYPEQNFVLLDAAIDCENVACYTWKDYELGFLAGVLGGMLTETNVMGFIGAHDIPLINFGAAGMIAGGRYVNPDITVLVDYVGGWAEVAGCNEMALAMYSQKADVFYHTASAGGLGIVEAGKKNNFFTIAFDGNLNADAPETNIASAIRSFPGAAKQAIAATLDGTFTGGTFDQGIAEGAVYLDFEGSTYPLSDEIMNTLKQVQEEIASGQITVPSTVEEARIWTP